MAVIEVIDIPSYNRSNGIFVITDQKDIRIRFYLVNTNNAVQSKQKELENPYWYQSVWEEMYAEKVVFRSD